MIANYLQSQLDELHHLRNMEDNSVSRFMEHLESIFRNVERTLRPYRTTVPGVSSVLVEIKRYFDSDTTDDDAFMGPRESTIVVRRLLADEIIPYFRLREATPLTQSFGFSIHLRPKKKGSRSKKKASRPKKKRSVMKSRSKTMETIVIGKKTYKVGTGGTKTGKMVKYVVKSIKRGGSRVRRSVNLSKKQIKRIVSVKRK